MRGIYRRPITLHGRKIRKTSFVRLKQDFGAILRYGVIKNCGWKTKRQAAIDQRRASSEVACGSWLRVWALTTHGLHFSPELLSVCIPRGGVELEELEKSAAATLVLFDKLVGIIERWLNELGDNISPADGLKAFALLAPALESVTILRGKIIEQRAAEARDVTAQMQTNLEASGKREAPKIEQTLELLRSRFNDNKKPKAN